MPVTNKAKWAQLRVGLMAIVALAIIGVLIFLLAGTKGLFKSKSEVYTYMSDSAGVEVASPVTLNGIYIGKVSKVALSGSTEPRRVVKLTMEVYDENLPKIPIDSVASVAAANLLGVKFMNIKKGLSPTSIKSGGEIASEDLTTIDDFVKQGNTALSAMQGILKKADDILNAVEVGQGTIGKLLVDETLYKKAIEFVDGGNKLIVTLNDTVNSEKGSVGKLLHDEGRLYDDIRGFMARLNNIMDGLDQGQGAAGKFLKDPAVYDDFRKALGDVRKLLADIDAGKGTMGKWLKKDDLHDQVQATIGRIDTMLDKINQGEGTLGQLLVNPALYESLDGTTREIQGLMKDFRANPKKFLSIKLHIF